jgi:phosphoglycolate phosphatase-like HAD superfamily hydrolase
METRSCHGLGSPHEQPTLGRPRAVLEYSPGEILVTQLAREQVRGLLLDWDGCMVPIRGEWHAVIAKESLLRSETFSSHASATLQECIKAYEGPGHGIDWFALFEQNLLKPKLEGLPHSEELVTRVMQELRAIVPIVSAEFARGLYAPELRISPNPGVEDFLQAAQSFGFSLAVVTMTPTPIVEAFAERSGLKRWIKEFHGCETFADFVDTKADPDLWREAATRVGLPTSEVAIVEDSVRSLHGAVRSGAAVVLSLTPDVGFLHAALSHNSHLWMAHHLGDITSVETLRRSKGVPA